MKTLLAALAALALAAPALAQTGADMAAPAAAAPAAGQGVIRKLDAKAGTVTLQHGPIAALGWPAMTMPFKAAPELLKDLKIGQAVTFTVRPGAPPEIVAIQPK